MAKDYWVVTYRAIKKMGRGCRRCRLLLNSAVAH
jgi:hypothetical protein